MEKYYVIYNSDGDTLVDELTDEEILKRLDNNNPYYGTLGFLESMPKDRDTNYWGDNLLIIKGSIFFPKNGNGNVVY